eukprot:4864920-Prymnesium_polylepis.1
MHGEDLRIPPRRVSRLILLAPPVNLAFREERHSLNQVLQGRQHGSITSARVPTQNSASVKTFKNVENRLLKLAER